MVHAIQLFTTCNIGIYGGEWVAQGNAAYHAILHILKRWIYNLLKWIAMMIRGEAMNESIAYHLMNPCKKNNRKVGIIGI